MGVRYERALEAELGFKWSRGRWFEYEDERGLGCCQVDFMREVGGRLWLLEGKYTWTWEGHEQLEELYRPVVARARGVDEANVGLVLVCKNLTVGTRRQVGRVVESLDNALVADAGRYSRTVLQWLPGTPIRVPRMGESRTLHGMGVG